MPVECRGKYAIFLQSASEAGKELIADDAVFVSAREFEQKVSDLVKSAPEDARIIVGRFDPLLGGPVEEKLKGRYMEDAEATASAMWIMGQQRASDN